MRFFWLVAAALSLWLPAAALAKAAPPAAPVEPVKEFTLSNGMKVLLVEDHAAPVATFAVFYKVGSRNEHVGNTGSSHLLEHMMFKGTDRFKKGEIMAALDKIGAKWNANTNYDYTNYFETVPADKLELAVSLEANRMRHSTILDQERDLERIVVRNELERSENEPEQALLVDLWATAFKAHPYHHPVIGWRPDVEGVPTSRLRDYYDQFYEPDNAVAVAVGDFKAEQALELVKKHFEALPGGHTFPQVYTEEAPQRGERRVVIRKAGELPVVEMGWKAPAASDPDTIPLKVLQLVLTGELNLGPYGDPLDSGISNRFYQALVEKELITQGGADYTPLKDPSLFTLICDVRPGVPHDKVESAVRAEIARLRNEPVAEAELARAKQRAQAAYGLMQDGTFGRTMLIGYFATIADWHLALDFPKKVQAVSAADIQRVAKKYLTDDTLTVGYFIPEKASAEHRSERALTLGRHAAAFRPEGSEATSIEGSAAAAPAAPASASVRREVLDNGLVVIVKENHAAPTFALSGNVSAGGAYDPAGKPHIASLVAEALSRGTQKHSKLVIAQKLEEVGASIGFGAGSEDVSFSARGLSKDLDRVLDLLAEELTSPAFDAQEVEKLKRETVAGLEQAEDSTQVKGRRALAQALFPKGHPYYSYPVEEQIRSVQGATPASLRAFYDQRYGASVTALVVVGDVKAEEVLAGVRKRLGSWKKVESPKLSIAKVPLRGQPGQRILTVPDKSNVDIFLGTQGELTRTDPDYYAASVANFVLGGAPSARLFAEIRDRLGLTYGIYSSLQATHGAGPWSIWMTVNPANVEKALAEVKKLATAFQGKGVTEQELASAKQTLAGRFRVGLSTNGGLANALAMFESYGLPPSELERHPQRIEAITLEQANTAAQKYFHSEKAFVAIAGSYPAPPKASAASK